MQEVPIPDGKELRYRCGVRGCHAPGKTYSIVTIYDHLARHYARRTILISTHSLRIRWTTLIAVMRGAGTNIDLIDEHFIRDHFARIPWTVKEHGNQHEGRTREKKESSLGAFVSLKEAADQLKNPKVRAHLFDPTVLSALCYGAETWLDTSTTSRNLKVTGNLT